MKGVSYHCPPNSANSCLHTFQFLQSETERQYFINVELIGCTAAQILSQPRRGSLQPYLRWYLLLCNYHPPLSAAGPDLIRGSQLENRSGECEDLLWRWPHGKPPVCSHPQRESQFHCHMELTSAKIPVILKLDPKLQKGISLSRYLDFILMRSSAEKTQSFWLRSFPTKP